MSKVRKTSRAANAELERQQAAGTHNPATQCSCGTWRTPGTPHTPGDTGATSDTSIARTCTK